MRFKKHYLSLIVLLLFTTSLFGQTKNEKEERVNLNVFPEAAVAIIKQLPKDCKKIKFYRETDNDRVSFEAKFKYKKQRFSLEFSKSGEAEDIEATVKFKSIKKKAKAAIESYFKKEFKKSKILKTQKQYILEKEKNLSKSIKKILSDKTNIDPNYEIIAEVKSKSERSIREFTFDNSGNFIQQRVVNPASYEHILY